MGETHFPHSRFGKKIKNLRENARESLAEVSGAIEIDTGQLIDIEAGRILPSEDILLLLISHFQLDDNDAVRLWELAGYDDDSSKRSTQDSVKQAVFMVVPVDNRVVYSDDVTIQQNKSGVILNFSQTNQDNKLNTIARIGMSKDEAKLMLGKLHSFVSTPELKHSSQKLLPSKTPKPTNKKQHRR